MSDYWKICVEEALEDADLNATPEQIDCITNWVEGAHENFGLATGSDIVSSNFRAEKEAEERRKIACLEKSHIQEVRMQEEAYTRVIADRDYKIQLLQDRLREVQND